jgi:hypothetical protein
LIQVAALVAIWAGAAWLVFVAGVTLAAPERARAGLAAMGSTVAINLAEHVPRALVGAAMVIRAPEAAWPGMFTAAGWFVVASSVVILAMPLRWHNGYARWWAARLPATAFRLLAIPALALAAVLAYGAM